MVQILPCHTGVPTIVTASVDVARIVTRGKRGSAYGSIEAAGSSRVYVSAQLLFSSVFLVFSVSLSIRSRHNRRICSWPRALVRLYRCRASGSHRGALLPVQVPAGPSRFSGIHDSCDDRVSK